MTDIKKKNKATKGEAKKQQNNIHIVHTTLALVHAVELNHFTAWLQLLLRCCYSGIVYVNQSKKYFQVHPLKDLTDIAPNEDPYVDCDPMVFKIIKKRSPEEQAKVEARKMVKLKKARDAEIRKALAEAVEDICKCAYMDVFCNDLSAIDRVIDSCPAFKEPDCICEEESLSSLSSNATWDIEYTPPFGCFDLAPRKRRTFIHVETQYIPADAGITETSPKLKCKRPSCASLRARRHCRRSCCGPCA